jgi:hypothetical protein
LKTFKTYLLYLLVLSILIFAAGSLSLALLETGLGFGDLIILLLSFSAIASLIMFLFFMGQQADPEYRMIFLMMSVGLKFILDIVLAMLWFFVGKKTSLPSLILFFVLYLAFTLFSTFAMLKTLKTKSL